MLQLKEDSSSTHCDILSILTVKLLFSFMTVALRHAWLRTTVLIECCDYIFIFQKNIQKIHVFIALSKTCDIFTTYTV